MTDEIEPGETRKEIEEEPKAEGASDSEESQQDLEEKEIDEERKDAEYIASATRAPRQGTYERFMVSSLASVTVMTDEVKRVKQISLAALFVPEDDRKELVIDYKRVEILNAAANAFLNSSSRKSGYDELVSIPWGFDPTEENYEKFIKPWYKCRVWYYAMYLHDHVEFERNRPSYELPRIKRIIMDPFWSWFFDATSCLSVDGYNILKNAFTLWATPQVQLYLAELTKMIDPNLYDQIVGLYEKRRRKGYAEKVSGTAEPKAEENANVDSVGPF